MAFVGQPTVSERYLFNNEGSLFSHIQHFFSFAVEDISFVFMEQSMTAKEIEGYFEKTVDEVMDDDVYLGKLVEFMISYCFYTAPRDKTLKEARQVQVDTYMVDMHDEINNNFKSLVEYNTLSDNAWTTWQYVNSYDDWALKKEALGQKVAKQKHKLQSKFTSNGHLRFQPMTNSEGMVLYQKMLKWYELLKANDLLNFAFLRNSKIFSFFWYDFSN